MLAFRQIRIAGAMLLLLVLGGCRAGREPVIGISSCWNGGRVSLDDAYPAAVRAAGGVPMILPPVHSAEEASRALAGVDALILSGGEDVAPARYGEAVLNSTVEVNAPRDTSDFLLAAEAMRRGIPVLGICRGSQLLNVLLGGSLYQDLPSQIGSLPRQGGDLPGQIGVSQEQGWTLPGEALQGQIAVSQDEASLDEALQGQGGVSPGQVGVSQEQGWTLPGGVSQDGALQGQGGSLQGQIGSLLDGVSPGQGAIRHFQTESDSVATHWIYIDPDSQLHALLGRDSVMVNSFHHQAVKNPGTGVRVVARSADGVIEAWEWLAPQRTGKRQQHSGSEDGHTDSRQTNGSIMCVQFHPECLVDAGDPTFLPLFQDLIAKSR